jgi:heme-degrading monooxygenase HmoA
MDDNEFNITTETIGTISHGVDGSDQYVLLTRWVDDLTPEDAEDWLLPQVYRETHQEAGGYFCRRVTTTQGESANKVIAIIHHCYDV